MPRPCLSHYYPHAVASIPVSSSSFLHSMLPLSQFAHKVAVQAVFLLTKKVLKLFSLSLSLCLSDCLFFASSRFVMRFFFFSFFLASAHLFSGQTEDPVMTPAVSINFTHYHVEILILFSALTQKTLFLTPSSHLVQTVGVRIHLPGYLFVQNLLQTLFVFVTVYS